MKKRIFIVGLALLSFIMLMAASILSSDKINQLFVFGDSLSDTGNVFRATGGTHPPSPPYFQGRFSNGLVWVEYLASMLELNFKPNNNFSYGGATTGEVSMNGVPGLLAQVDSFTKADQKANPNALYILWAGANDYLYGAANPTQSIEDLSRAVESLVKVGAKKIMVANLPDLGKVPATSHHPNANILTSLTITHNISLAKSLDILNQKLDYHTQIIKFDVNSLYLEAITNPEKFSLTNVTTACLNNLTTCDRPEKFLFWDGIHPTTAAHRVLAEAAFKGLPISSGS
ncbi:MAG: SGNH/GDSL hydrolase family protein [Rhizonema sp. PD38]|nr:SGNH/GDSL hydrolase family protein [Rhizonema sp. PD38]